MIEQQEVLDFWFKELKPAQHFKKDPSVDAEIARRFASQHQNAASGKLARWRTTADGRLAEIIVLDQFSRNLFRDDARAWEQDDLALSLAREMVGLGLDTDIALERRAYVYMPYMHNEDIDDQHESVRLFGLPGLESNLKFAILHRDVIAQFGRFPYRNELLGRDSTPDELVYIDKHGSF